MLTAASSAPLMRRVPTGSSRPLLERAARQSVAGSGIDASVALPTRARPSEARGLSGLAPRPPRLAPQQGGRGISLSGTEWAPRAVALLRRGELFPRGLDHRQRLGTGG